MLLTVLIALIAANTQSTELNWVVGTSHASLVWIVFTTAVIGWRDFYVRQLRDWKGSAEIETMMPKSMTIYARLCGWTLARAHARSGDPIAIAAYLGKGHAFDRAIAAFSALYADRNEADYALLKEAVASGRVSAEFGL